MAYSITLTDDEAETFADIRMRLCAIAGPHLWPDLLIAIVDDYLAAWDRPPREYDDLSGYLLRQRQQADSARAPLPAPIAGDC